MEVNEPIEYALSQKGELLETLKDPNDKLIAVDMDGTLCTGEFWKDEEEPQPIPETVELVKKLYLKGAHIVIYTARRPELYPLTMAWLIKNGIPFHGIAMTYKCGADLYIDDKVLRPEELI